MLRSCHSSSHPTFGRGALIPASLVAVALAAGGGRVVAQTTITTSTTVNSSTTYSSLLVGSATSPGPTLTINSPAAISITTAGTTGFTVGSKTNPYAAVVHNGGTVTSDSALYLGFDPGSADTPYSPAGSPSYTLNGGSIDLQSTSFGFLAIGRSVPATFTQTGGTIIARRNDVTSLAVGGGTYSITGGTFEGVGTSNNAESQPGVAVAGRLAATLSINGPAAVVASNVAGMAMATNNGNASTNKPTATVNLQAGTLALNGNVTRGRPASVNWTPPTNGSGAVSFTLGGGTLRPYNGPLQVGTILTGTEAFDVTLAAGTTSTISSSGWKTGSNHRVDIHSPLVGTGNIEITGGSQVWFNSANNTYSGTTTVSGGTLVLAENGAFPNTSLLTVASGARLTFAERSSDFSLNDSQTLAGSGQVGLPTNAQLLLAGTLAPGIGSTPGTLQFIEPSTLNLTSAITSQTGRLQFGLGPTGASDRVTVAGGTLAIGTGLLEFNDFAFTELGGFGQGTYTLFSALSLSGTLGPATSGSIGSFTGTLQQAGSEIQLVVVPEPQGLGLAGLGLAAAAWAARRRAAVR